MTREALLREKRYLACLSLLHSLRERALLSDDEYERAKALLIETHQPRLSILFE